MNRFAQSLYGKIIYIYETHLKKDQLSTIFDPSTFWIDVTGLDCEVGYIVNFKENVGLILTPPPNDEPQTLEKIKLTQIEILKAERDRLEVEPIEYNGNIYDYDDKARERINAAIIALELSGKSIEWTLADNTSTPVTATDLKMVIASVAMRSNDLHVAYRNAKEAVERAKTKEEVEAVALEVE